MTMQPSQQGGGAAATVAAEAQPTARSGTQSEPEWGKALDTLNNVYDELYGFAFKGKTVSSWNTLLEQLQAAKNDIRSIFQSSSGVTGSMPPT